MYRYRGQTQHQNISQSLHLTNNITCFLHFPFLQIFLLSPQMTEISKPDTVLTGKAVKRKYFTGKCSTQRFAKSSISIPFISIATADSKLVT